MVLPQTQLCWTEQNRRVKGSRCLCCPKHVFLFLSYLENKNLKGTSGRLLNVIAEKLWKLLKPLIFNVQLSCTYFSVLLCFSNVFFFLVCSAFAVFNHYLKTPFVLCLLTFRKTVNGNDTHNTLHYYCHESSLCGSLRAPPEGSLTRVLTSSSGLHFPQNPVPGTDHPYRCQSLAGPT